METGGEGNSCRQSQTISRTDKKVSQTSSKTISFHLYATLLDNRCCRSFLPMIVSECRLRKVFLSVNRSQHLKHLTKNVDFAKNSSVQTRRQTLGTSRT